MPDRASESRATEVARELARVRQRGISNLDVSGQGQRPLDVPQLEGLARGRAVKNDRDRISLIRDLIMEGLDAYAARSAAEAKLVRDLFFDAEGRSPGPGGPGRLLDSVRTEAKMDEDAFRRRQRQYFETFAAYLLDYEQPALEQWQAVAEVREYGRRQRGALWAAVVAVVVIGLVSAFIWRAHGGGPAASPRGTAGGPTGAAVLFRFDDLGSTTGDIIYVYPGVEATPTDRKPDGTYKSGQTAPALCLAHGRMIKSDPNQGEQTRTSDLWVRIQGTPGLIQYATLTYGELQPSAAKLRQC